MAFSEHETPVFMLKVRARFYAWRARRRGFETTIHDYGRISLSLGGRYGVELSKVKGATCSS